MHKEKQRRVGQRLKERNQKGERKRHRKKKESWIEGKTKGGKWKKGKMRLYSFFHFERKPYNWAIHMFYTSYSILCLPRRQEICRCVKMLSYWNVRQFAVRRPCTVLLAVTSSHQRVPRKRGSRRWHHVPEHCTLKFNMRVRFLNRQTSRHL